MSRFFIDNGFGGKDERKMQEVFEDLCGGAKKAERLSYLWDNSYKCDMRPQGILHTKQTIFEAKAKAEGFTKDMIDCFYAL